MTEHKSIDYSTRKSTKRKITSAERRAMAEAKNKTEIVVEPESTPPPSDEEVVQAVEKARHFIPEGVPKKAYKKYESVDELLLDVTNRVGTTIQYMARRVEKNARVKKTGVRTIVGHWQVFRDSIKLVLELEQLIKERQSHQILPQSEEQSDEKTIERRDEESN